MYIGESAPLYTNVDSVAFTGYDPFISIVAVDKKRFPTITRLTATLDEATAVADVKYIRYLYQFRVKEIRTNST